MQIPRCYVSEIFHSIQGEGVLQGFETLFVRFQGCHQACKWCDTKHSWKQNKKYEWKSADLLKEILTSVKGTETWVCLTGGEPMEQFGQVQWLIEKMHKNDVHNISIETSGLPIPDKKDLTDLLDMGVFFSISPKMGSALGARFDAVEFNHIVRTWGEYVYVPHKMQYKFVVSSEADLKLLASYCRTWDTPHHLIIQVEASMIADKPFIAACYSFVRQHPHFRLSMQIHKLLCMR